MPIRLELVFDLTQNRNATRPLQERYATALDMAAWADQAGFQAINFGEHHNNEFNYLSSPLLMGAAAGARTRNIQLRMILLTPFYHPLRLAEDLAVVSMQTDYRAFAVLCAGYRQAEFDMFGLDQQDRADTVLETVALLRKAWSGEPFEYQGRRITQLSPIPDRPPRIILGGNSPLMARNAARVADGFSPATRPGLYEAYRAERIKLGKPDPGPAPTQDGPGFVYVTEDPEATWQAVGPHILQSMGIYTQWFGEAGKGRLSDIYHPLTTLEELKQSPAVAVVSPEQCIALAESLGDTGRLRIQALPTGIAP